MKAKIYSDYSYPTKEEVVNYVISEKLEAVKELIVPTEEQVQQLKSTICRNYEEYMKKGLDIGTLAKDMIQGRFVFFRDELYFEDEKTNKLYSCFVL